MVLRDRAKKYLAQHLYRSAREMADALGISIQDAHVMLHRMRRSGEVVKTRAAVSRASRKHVLEFRLSG